MSLTVTRTSREGLREFPTPQLGYAMGNPVVAGLAFAVVMEQSTQMLLIQEHLLEMGPIAILMSKDV